jgi:hypothetical protein
MGRAVVPFLLLHPLQVRAAAAASLRVLFELQIKFYWQIIKPNRYKANKVRINWPLIRMLYLVLFNFLRLRRGWRLVVSAICGHVERGNRALLRAQHRGRGRGR